MYREWSGRAEFLFVYIREAHASDAWQLAQNERDDVILAQPKTFDERRNVAQTCAAELALSMPCVVDDMENSVDTAYAGWPERLYVVDTHGRIAYAGLRGPFGFDPAEVARWLETNLGQRDR
jgi:type I thyroxine 5'-deiodinase